MSYHTEKEEEKINKSPKKKGEGEIFEYAPTLH